MASADRSGPGIAEARGLQQRRWWSAKPGWPGAAVVSEGAGEIAGALEEVGADGVEAVVAGEARVGGEGVEVLEAGGGAVDHGERDGVVERDGRPRRARPARARAASRRSHGRLALARRRARPRPARRSRRRARGSRRRRSSSRFEPVHAPEPSLRQRQLEVMAGDDHPVAQVEPMCPEILNARIEVNGCTSMVARNPDQPLEQDLSMPS